jgi:hypothetical protein
MKTGTTAIQVALAKHHDSIVVYPKIGAAPTGAHYNLVRNFYGKQGNTPKFVPGDIGSLFGEIGASARSTGLDVVISSAALLPMSGARSDGSRVREFADALLRHLNGETDSFQVEVLIACREHFERAASYYNQRVTGRYSAKLTTTPDEFLTGAAASLCYAPKILNLRKLGLEVRVLNYHPARDWVARFLGHIGFPESRIPHWENKNVSLGPSGLIAQLAANSVSLSTRDERRFRRSLEDLPESRASSKFIFNKESMTEAEHHFRQDRKFLLDECGVELPVPDLNRHENTFHLDEDSLAQIAAAARRLEHGGEDIVHFARQYLRT